MGKIRETTFKCKNDKATTPPTMWWPHYQKTSFKDLVEIELAFSFNAVILSYSFSHFLIHTVILLDFFFKTGSAVVWNSHFTLSLFQFVHTFRKTLTKTAILCLTSHVLQYLLNFNLSLATFLYKKPKLKIKYNQPICIH